MFKVYIRDKGKKSSQPPDKHKPDNLPTEIDSTLPKIRKTENEDEKESTNAVMDSNAVREVLESGTKNMDNANGINDIFKCDVDSAQNMEENIETFMFSSESQNSNFNEIEPGSSSRVPVLSDIVQIKQEPEFHVNEEPEVNDTSKPEVNVRTEPELNIKQEPETFNWDVPLNIKTENYDDFSTSMDEEFVDNAFPNDDMDTYYSLHTPFDLKTEPNASENDVDVQYEFKEPPFVVNYDDEVEDTDEGLEVTQMNEDQFNRFCCPYCPKRYSLHVTLINHMKICQSNEERDREKPSSDQVATLKSFRFNCFEEMYYYCRLCNFMCFMENNLKSHMQRNHLYYDDGKYLTDEYKSWSRAYPFTRIDNKRTRCKICQETINSVLFNKHLAKKHEINETGIYSCACPKCPARFTRMKGLRSHFRSFHGNVHNCPVCPDKEFRNIYLFQNHVTAEHKDILYCEFCCGCFNNENDFANHDIEFNYCLRGRNCKFCDRIFHKKKSLILHIRSVHIEELGKNAAGKKIIVHKKSSGDTPASSGDTPTSSGDTTTSSGDADTKLDVKVEPENMVYFCHLCFGEFAVYSEFDDHMTSFHELHRLQCSLCPSAFYDKYMITKHRQTMHKRPEKIQQPIQPVEKCIFTAKKRHEPSPLGLLKMTGKFNGIYSCDKCDKSFNLKTGLDKHIRLFHP